MENVFSRPSKAEVLKTSTDLSTKRGESHILYRPLRKLHESKVFRKTKVPSPEEGVGIKKQHLLGLEEVILELKKDIFLSVLRAVKLTFS